MRTKRAAELLQACENALKRLRHEHEEAKRIHGFAEERETEPGELSELGALRSLFLALEAEMSAPFLGPPALPPPLRPPTA